MFGNHFYHKRVRTAVSVFGSLFNDMYVLREDAAGDIISQVKCPLSYAPKRSFLERLKAMTDGEGNERMVAVKLPRMSFEVTSMNYDATRQLPKMNNFTKAVGGSNTTKKRYYTSVPYDIAFQLNIYAKSQDDALQIVEQIIPYFNPQYTVSVKPFIDQVDIVEDVPVILSGVSFSDDYEGAVGDRRTIIYTLDFNMKVSFFGPVNTGSIVREVKNNFYIMQPDGSDTWAEGSVIAPNPIDVSPEDDYGFNVTSLDNEA